MATVNLDDAKAHLREIISGLNPGEQLMIVQEGEPVATLTPLARINGLARPAPRKTRNIGWRVTLTPRSKSEKNGAVCLCWHPCAGASRR